MKILEKFFRLFNSRVGGGTNNRVAALISEAADSSKANLSVGDYLIFANHYVVRINKDDFANVRNTLPFIARTALTLLLEGLRKEASLINHSLSLRNTTLVFEAQPIESGDIVEQDGRKHLRNAGGNQIGNPDFCVIVHSLVNWTENKAATPSGPTLTLRPTLAGKGQRRNSLFDFDDIPELTVDSDGRVSICLDFANLYGEIAKEAPASRADKPEKPLAQLNMCPGSTAMFKGRGGESSACVITKPDIGVAGTFIPAGDTTEYIRIKSNKISTGHVKFHFRDGGVCFVEPKDEVSINGKSLILAGSPWAKIEDGDKITLSPDVSFTFTYANRK